MNACRDCARCTEAAARSLLLFPGRFLWTLFFGWNIGVLLPLFSRQCPQCGHPLRWHARPGGRFAD